MEKIVQELNFLHAELTANKGIMPDSWKPYCNALLAILTIMKMFCKGDLAIIITELIAAIEAAEQL